MVVPVILKRQAGSDVINNLPIIFPEYTKTFKLGSTSRHKVKNSKDYYHNVEHFDSIFDAAAIGQYLGGIDPMHKNSEPGFINETCIFNPSKCTFDWQLDEEGRKIPLIGCNGRQYKLNNLHIHSKALYKFAS